ncbi:MAG: hypothetical protein HFF18_03680 [Oscillospiraceae bacterium]|nr:hypothetical protein [Oscillospiraceae bacterium]
MHKPPDKPCEDCEHAPCRLPLNCGRWLDYLSAKRRHMSDMAALRQVRLSKRYDRDTASELEWQRKLAEACPWRQEEDTVGKQIDYDQVRALYDQGLNDPAIAEQMEISNLTIQRWRKKNNLPARGRMKQEKPEAPVEVSAEPASEAEPEPDVSSRVRQLLALVRPEDSDAARNLTARLAGQWILDFLSAECTETCNKAGCATHK